MAKKKNSASLPVLAKGKKPDFIDAPGVIDPNAYALEIAGDSMLPVYREGDMIIVSPSTPVKDGTAF